MHRTLLLLTLAAATASGKAMAQTTESGGAPVRPATAAPQTEQQPNLRTDAQPRLSLSPATDNAPLPETLGVDATPYFDLGPDWSLPARDNETTTMQRIFMHKGQIEVEQITTHGVTPLPVTNPPLPPTMTISNIPDPPTKLLPKPPDPLAAVQQPTHPIAP